MIEDVTCFVHVRLIILGCNNNAFSQFCTLNLNFAAWAHMSKIAP